MKKIAAIVIISIAAVSVVYMIFFQNSSQNKITVISDEKYFPYLISSIKSANSSIKVIMFEARMYSQANSSANQIIIELANAKKRNVDVKVILEGGETFLGQDFFDYQNKTCLFLKNNSIETRFDPAGITTHAKLVIIDCHIIIIGSTNWNYQALENNHETDVLIDSNEAAKDLENYFEGLWKDSKDCQSQ